MKYIVDRFEGNFVLCENDRGEFINIKRKKLPQNTKEGDVLVQKGDSFVIDIEETKKRKEYIEKLAKELWK